MEDRRTRAARTHFDRWSQTYETDTGGRWLQEVQTEALAALGLSSGDVLLDLACGTGAGVRAAAPDVSRAVGFDCPRAGSRRLAQEPTGCPTSSFTRAT